MATDEFDDVEIVDVEPEPAALWAGETILTKRRKPTTVLSGGVNLLNTIIGAGILSIPFAMARQGVVFGTFLVLFVALLGHVSMTMLGKVGERVLADYHAYGVVPLPDATPSLDVLMTPRLSLDTAQATPSPRTSTSGNTTPAPTDCSVTPAGVMRGTDPARTPQASLDLLRTQTPNTGSSAASTQQPLEPRVTFPWVTKRVKPWLTVVLEIAMIIFCLGVCVAYLILIGDSMPQVIGFIVDDHPETTVASSLLSSSSPSSSLIGSVSSATSEAAVRLPALRRRELWISIAIVIVAPFTFAKRLDALRYLSWGTVLCVLYMLAMLIYYFVVDFDRIFADGYSFDLGPVDSSAINNISVIIFSYTCQPNFYSIFDELGEKKRRKRANRSSAIACASSGILYSLFGILGYLIGGREVASNVVDSLPTYDTLVLIARIALVFVVTFSYPVIFHPMRICFESVFARPRFSKLSDRARRYIIAAVLVLITWAISLAFKQLDVVLNLTGATGATLMSFIVPGYMLWVAFPDGHKCPSGWFQYIGLIVAIFGVIFMVASVVLTFVNL